MKKLIILGAGANVDFGFPTGLELSKLIHSGWRRSNEKYTGFLLVSLKKHNKQFNGFDDAQKTAAKRINQLSHRFYLSGAESIDDFLSRSLEDFEVSFGKLTILNLLLEKERESINAEAENKKTIFQWENNWLRILFGKEFRFEKTEELENKLTQDPVKFITFNYDRSLEHFIFNAIKNYYGIDPKTAAQICKKIYFYHVYGKLAPLEWELDGSSRWLEYGSDLKDAPYNIGDTLFRYTSNIKVMNEDRNNFESIKNTCKDLIAEADKVYILGFGFLQSNYKLLGIDEYRQSFKNNKLPLDKFYYTAYGLSKNKMMEVDRNFGSLSGFSIAKATESVIYDYIHHHY